MATYTEFGEIRSRTTSSGDAAPCALDAKGDTYRTGRRDDTSEVDHGYIREDR